MVSTRGGGGSSSATITSFMQARKRSAPTASDGGRPVKAARGSTTAAAAAAPLTLSAPKKNSGTTTTTQITLEEAYAAAAEKVSNPKFFPRPLGKNVKSTTDVVDGKVPVGASILIIQRPWIDLILDGHKTLEIRGKPCNKSNERIYLALSGGGGVVIGSVTFAKCHGPLSRAEWAARGEQHRVAGDSVLPYGGSTYAWELVKPVRFKQPVVYKHKPGVVVWAKME